MTMILEPTTPDQNTEILKNATLEQQQKHQQLKALIEQCTGSEAIHRTNRLWRYFVVTDGILEMVKAFNAYWFCDLVGKHSPRILQRDYFACLELTVQANQSAEFIAHNGCEPSTTYATESITWTTFPVGKWKFYLSLSEDTEGSPLHILLQTREH